MVEIPQNDWEIDAQRTSVPEKTISATPPVCIHMGKTDRAPNAFANAASAIALIIRIRTLDGEEVASASEV